MRNIEIYTIDGFKNFVEERELCRINKNNEWNTEDEILKKKKFCNIDRNHDRGTVNFYKSLNGKSDELKILSIITFRMFSSGNLICDMVEKSETLEQFKNEFLSAEKFSDRGMPYQFVSYVKGVNFKVFFENYIYKNKECIIKTVLNFNKVGYLEAIDEIHKAVGFEKKLKFGIFQGCLDIAELYPHLIDPMSEPLYGIGSLNSLNEMLKNEKYESHKELIEISKTYVNNSLSVLEHGLCEYDKYCKYRLGIKKIDSNTQNYISIKI